MWGTLGPFPCMWRVLQAVCVDVVRLSEPAEPQAAGQAGKNAGGDGVPGWFSPVERTFFGS